MDSILENKTSLIRQSAWLACAKVIGFALSFLLPLLVVRHLAQEEVGLYRQVFLVVVTGASIIPLGFSMSSFYYLSREVENRASAMFHILIFNFFMGGLACLALYIYPQFLGNIFQSDEMTRLSPLIGIVIWLWMFSAFVETAALANQEARLAATFIVGSQFTKALLMAGAVLIFATVESFLQAAMIQASIQTIVLFGYLNSRFPRFWRSGSLPFFRRQLIYALPFGMVGLFYTIQTDIHNYFVGYRFTEAEFAIYAYGCFQLPLIAVLYESLSSVLIPRMSELELLGKKREMLLTALGASEKLALAYFPIFIFLMITAEEFIVTLFTSAYRESVPIFRINLVLIPFACLMLDPVARAFPDVGKFLLKSRIILFFALISSLYYGIHHFGLTGIIAVVVITVLIERAISALKIFNVLGASTNDVYLLRNIAKTALASLLSGMFLFLFYELTKTYLLNVTVGAVRNVFASIGGERAADFVGSSMFLAIWLVVFGAIYTTSIFITGAIADEDMAKLSRILHRSKRRVEPSPLDLRLEPLD